MKAAPDQFWVIQVMAAISVRRRSTPLKQSMYEVPDEMDFSLLLEKWISAEPSANGKMGPKAENLQCVGVDHESNDLLGIE